MCKQDIRIAEAAAAKQPTTPARLGSGTAALPANPNRYAVSLAIEIASPATEFVEVIFYVDMGGHWFPLAMLNNDVQSMIINIQQIGQVIRYPIVYQSSGPDAPSFVYWAESAFDQSLESIP